MRKTHLLGDLFLVGGLSFVVASADAARPDTDGRAVEGGRLPNGATARLGTTRLRHGDGLFFVGYLPDGKSLLTASKDKTVRLWDLATGREVRRFIRGEEAPGSEGHPADSGRNGATSLGGRMAATSTIPMGVAALSRDGSHVAVAVGRSVSVWQTSTGKRLHQTEGAKPFILLAFSPDGASLAGVDIHMTVTVWNVASGRGDTRLPARVAGPDAEFSAIATSSAASVVAISPDLQYLAWDRIDVKTMSVSLRFTSIATGKEPRGDPFLRELPQALAFSPDGRSLIWAGNDQNVHVTEIATGRETLRTEKAGQNAPIVSLTLSPDSKTLAVARFVFDKPEIRVELWDLSTRKRRHAIVTPDSPELGLLERSVDFIRLGRSLGGARAFSPDGATLAASLGGAATARLFDVATGKEVRNAEKGHQAAVEALGLAPGSDKIYTFAKGDGMLAWDPASGEALGHISLPPDTEAAAFSADGRRVAAVAGWSSVVVAELTTGRLIHTFGARDLGLVGASNPLFGGGKGIATIALSPDGRTLATRRVGSADIRLWDVDTGNGLHTLTQSAAPAEAADRNMSGGEASGISTREIAFSADGRYLAGAGAKWQLCLWEVGGGRTVWEAVLPVGSNVVRLAFSADGRSLAALDADGSVILVEVATGQTRERFGEPKGTTRKGTIAINMGGVSQPFVRALPSGLGFSPDSRRLAVSSGTPIVGLWNVLTGKEVGKFEGHTGSVACLAFTPDGRRLISGSSDTTALVWEAARAFGPRAEGGRPLDVKELGALWSDVAGADAGRAFVAVQRLVAAPHQTVEYVKEHLRPAPMADTDRVAVLVTTLGDAKLAPRQEAEKELEKLGELAGPQLREALRDNPPLALRQRIERLLDRVVGPVPAGDSIRDLRAIELLERIGDNGARSVLEAVARGAPNARSTRDAKASLARLAVGSPEMR